MAKRGEIDEGFMRRALALAERGRGHTRPNPIVGAVVVRGGRVVGEGWHRALGAPHAEVGALLAAGRAARGATLYVTLEPCAHAGRTPPCVDAIIAAGIRRCVVALRDPHRIVNGRGLRRLRAAGLRVDLGCLAAEARAVLGGYWTIHTQSRPRVTLKLAASLDGRIAPAGGLAASGRGRWLTGVPARRAVHRMRALADAIVIGSETARLDDPRLTVRGVRGALQPLRIVCDADASLPLTLKLFRAPLARGTVLACTRRAPLPRVRAFERRGVRVWRLRAGLGGVCPAALAERLAEDGRQELMIEGGATLAGSWLRAALVDRLALFTAPTILGSEGLAWAAPLHAAAQRGHIVEHRRLGEDTLTVTEIAH